MAKFVLVKCGAQQRVINLDLVKTIDVITFFNGDNLSCVTVHFDNIKFSREYEEYICKDIEHENMAGSILKVLHSSLARCGAGGCVSLFSIVDSVIDKYQGVNQK